MAYFNTLTINQTLDTQIADENWHYVSGAGEPAFMNSWVNYSYVDFARCAFRRNSKGYIFLQGLVKNGTVFGFGDTAAIYQLPSGYRPHCVTPNTGGAIIFQVVSGGAYGEVRVEIDGHVKVVTGNSGWLSLNGIYFQGEL